MKSLVSVLAIILTVHSAVFAQSEANNKRVILTGARFTYPLFEKWIKEYKEAYPSADLYIEPRTATDPSQYDILIEAYEQDKAISEDREYLYIGRYALIPVANAKSKFAQVYADKGLNKKLIGQIFFNDIYADKDKQEEIKAPYNVYTRLQKAGAPTTFARYFGYDQQNIKGKAIAGADEHLIKALLKDSIGVSYNNLGLIYDLQKRTVLPGLSILPVDADNNGRISNEEKFYGNLDEVIAKLESTEVENVPVEYFHISLRKRGYNPEALKFLLWVIDHSQEDLHQFGFLKPELKRFESEKQKFEQLAKK